MAMSKALTPEAIADALKLMRAAKRVSSSPSGKGDYNTAILALEAIGRVRELHKREYDALDIYPPECGECGSPWPCETIAVIDGEGEHGAT